MARAHRHFAAGTDDDCHPFLNSRSLVPVQERIAAAWRAVSGDELPFDSLYRWAELDGPETAEMVVSLLLELHDGDDDQFDALFLVDERSSADPGTTVAETRSLLDGRFGWLAGLDLDGPGSDRYWWVVSDNTEEPRRARRDRLPPEHRDVAIDVALRLWRLRAALREWDDDTPMHRVLSRYPEHRMAVERLHASDRRYGEPRDNACSADYLPLQIQRFQLAMYGMDNYKPKSTDWLRVTLFQGAPRLEDMGPDVTDDWVLPHRPGMSENPGAQDDRRRP